MMEILGIFGMIAKHETLFLLTLLSLFPQFYLPLQIVTEHSFEWDGWLRIEGVLLQLATAEKRLTLCNQFL